MTIDFPACFIVFENIAMSRTPSGVLTVRFHTNGGPVRFTGQRRTDL